MWKEPWKAEGMSKVKVKPEAYKLVWAGKPLIKTNYYSVGTLFKELTIKVLKKRERADNNVVKILKIKI